MTVMARITATATATYILRERRQTRMRATSARVQVHATTQRPVAARSSTTERGLSIADRNGALAQAMGPAVKLGAAASGSGKREKSLCRSASECDPFASGG